MTAMKAPLPHDEQDRVSTLHRLKLLDTGAEEVFDDIVSLAAHLCSAPIGLMSLVDTHRQWFKARVGLDVQETTRDASFCAHAILKPDDILVVEDATKDDRFAENPLVIGEPKIRFYAGVPLVTADGHPLGTLCVIDRKPRRLTAEQESALRALCRSLVTELELRRATQDLVRLNESLDRRVREQTAAGRESEGKMRALVQWTVTSRKN
ncbi:MAG TPA: hypothetical protein DCY13_00280, partial [Verrucomicrobiales bacterium]|nr:hypothetical protein [Verrucomicrobiales bacterium]